MTDTAEAGSVVETPPAGAPAQPAPTADNGSAADGNNPFSGLQNEGALKWVETKGYKTVEDVVAAAHSLEQRLGTSVTVPAADATAEDWAKFYERFPEDRRPIAAPDKIEFKRPENLPENVPYSDELANAAKPWMHEAGLSPKQAQLVHDKFAGYLADLGTQQQLAVAKSVETTFEDLVKEWGPQESDGFKTKLELANRAMKGLGLVDAYKSTGILLQDGALTNPQIAKAFAAIGESMFAEDTIGSDGAPKGENPFKRDASGGRNLAAISALVKSDPERAKRMAREAGENPDLWVR